MQLRLLAMLFLFACLSILVPALHIGTPPASARVGQVEPVVYASDGGPKYHTAFCTQLGQSHFAMTLSEANKAGYSPCPICGGAPSTR